MEALISYYEQQPIYLTLLLVFGLFLIWSAIKAAVKMTLLLFAIVAALGFYCNYDYRGFLEEIEKKPLVDAALEHAQKYVNEHSGKVVSVVIKNVKEEIK